jgi:molecular chaperone GrpE
MKKEKKKNQVEELKKEKEEYLDGWKRAKADLLNYKKDEHKRVEVMVFREKEKLFKKILVILDNLNRAEEEVKKREESNEIIEGFLRIKGQLFELLKEEGVEEIESLGKEFDPFYHDAIEMCEDSSMESGVVVEEYEKGYLYKNEVIRPAKVKVNK